MHKSTESAAVAELIGEHIQTEDERLAFDRKVALLMAQSDLLDALEEIRAEEGVSKAEVARRVGTPASVVSRLLSGRASNPTLRTLLEVAEALDVYLDIKIKPQPKRAARHAPLEIEQLVA